MNELDLEDTRDHEIALVGKEMTKRGSHFHSFFGALLFYEWHDFVFWWHNSIEASKLDQPEKPLENEGDDLRGEEMVDTSTVGAPVCWYS